MQGDAGVIDVSSLLSALIGAGAAIGAVYVAASRERIARQAEEKARFQRETLIELQEALQVFFRETYALHLWRESPREWERISKELRDRFEQEFGSAALVQSSDQFDLLRHHELLDENGHLATWTDTRFCLESLTARIDNHDVRAGIAAIIETTRPVLSQEVFEASKPSFTLLTDLIGALIREGVLTSSGFVVPAQQPPNKRSQ